MYIDLFCEKKIFKGDISKILCWIVMGMLRKCFCIFLYNYIVFLFLVYFILCYLLYFDSLMYFYIEFRGNV